MLGKKSRKFMYIVALWALLSVDFVFPLDLWTHAAFHLIVGIAGTLLVLGHD